MTSTVISFAVLLLFFSLCCLNSRCTTLIFQQQQQMSVYHPSSLRHHTHHFSRRPGVPGGEGIPNYCLKLFYCTIQKLSRDGTTVPLQGYDLKHSPNNKSIWNLLRLLPSLIWGRSRAYFKTILSWDFAIWHTIKRGRFVMRRKKPLQQFSAFYDVGF
jgi:hypothetical protein